VVVCVEYGCLVKVSDFLVSARDGTPMDNIQCAYRKCVRGDALQIHFWMASDVAVTE